MKTKRIKEIFEPEYAIRPYKECNNCPYGFPIAKNSVFYSKFNCFCLRFEDDPCPHEVKENENNSRNSRTD